MNCSYHYLLATVFKLLSMNSNKLYKQGPSIQRVNQIHKFNVLMKRIFVQCIDIKICCLYVNFLPLLYMYVILFRI